MLGFALTSLLLGTAHADEVGVLVPPFEASSPDMANMAALLSLVLQGELDRNERLRVVTEDQAPLVYEMTAEIYLSSCPPGEAVGCAWVVANAAELPWAVAGVVSNQGGVTVVDVHIVDVVGSRTAVDFRLALGVQDDKRFARGVADVLLATIGGDMGDERDIRAGDPDPQAPQLDKAAIAAQLEQLSVELGGVTTLEAPERGTIARPTFTQDDLAQQMDREGAKPWERLEMKPGEYMRYKNSDLQLYEWRWRSQGRQGQVLLRPLLGVARAPVDGIYHGRYARSQDSLEVAEVYAFQALSAGSGGLLGANAGWGLSPELEVGLALGVVSGDYLVQIRAETEGDTPGEIQGDEFSNRSLFVGPRLLYVPFPQATVRPVGGGELLYWRGTTITSRAQPPPELPTFSAPGLALVSLIGGVEARMSEHLDLWAHVPIQVVVAGESSTLEHTGSGLLQAKDEPPSLSAVGAGLQVGFTVRLLGTAPVTSDLDEDLDPDE